MVFNPNSMSPIVWWQYLPGSAQLNNSDDITVHTAVKYSQLYSTFQMVVLHIFILSTMLYIFYNMD